MCVFNFDYESGWQVAACHRMVNHFVMWIDVLVRYCQAMNQWTRAMKRTIAKETNEGAVCPDCDHCNEINMWGGVVQKVARHRRVSLSNWPSLFVIMDGAEDVASGDAVCAS